MIALIESNIMGKKHRPDFSQGESMTKQIHINLDDAVYDALNEYSAESGETTKEVVSKAIMELLQREKKEVNPKVK